jgi:hypothetical protein
MKSNLEALLHSYNPWELPQGILETKKRKKRKEKKKSKKRLPCFEIYSP